MNPGNSKSSSKMAMLISESLSEDNMSCVHSENKLPAVNVEKVGLPYKYPEEVVAPGSALRMILKRYTTLEMGVLPREYLEKVAVTNKYQCIKVSKPT